MENNISRRKFLINSGLVSTAALIDPKKIKAITPVQPLQGSRAMGKKIKEVHSVCEMCFWRCLITGKVEGDTLVKIDGNPNSPSNEGKVCARGNAGVKLLYDPDRLKYPMKRVGPRGSGQYKRISWDEAITEIAENINRIHKEHGNQSVAMFPHGSSASFFEKYMHSLGSKSNSEASFYQCRGNRDIGYKLTFGEPPGSPERIDLANSKAMLFIGSHLGENLHLSQTKDWITGLENGSKLVVVDPRFSVAASKADIWLQIKPGTDVALLMAWSKYLIDNKLIDAEFVEANCYGLEEFQEATKHATIEWAAEITDLEPEKMIAAIKMLASQSPHVAIHPGRHSTWYGTNDTQRPRAMAIMTALLGAFGQKGGLFLKTKIKMKKPKSKLRHKKDKSHTYIRDKWAINLPGTPGADLIDATLGNSDAHDAIKGWVVWGQNVLQSTPNPDKTLEAIKKLDFLAVVELRPTPATDYADIILPEATYLERYDLVLGNQHTLQPYVTYRKPMVKPMYESKDPYWITKQIATKMGHPDAFPWKDSEEVVDSALESIGLSRKEIDDKGGVVTVPGTPYLEKGEEYSFKTSSGLIELYSDKLKELGFDPVPQYHPPVQGEEGSFRLLYGRTPVHTMSRTQNNAWLHSEHPENHLWVHPEIAKQLGIKHDQKVKLENQNKVVSSTALKVKVTPGIRKDCVYMEAMFGSPAKELKKAFESGVADGSLMTANVKDPILGTIGLRNNFVKIRPIT